MAQRDIEASQRATAKMLGVDESTVRADLGKRRTGNPAPDISEPQEMSDIETGETGNPAPAWFQDDADPAKLAKTRTKRKQKDAERIKDWPPQ